jgi:hypothetical protein
MDSIIMFLMNIVFMGVFIYCLFKRIINIGFKYDIYLAGPWEKYCITPWKSIIKKELSGVAKIYDPEDYQDGDWFENDLKAIRKSRYMICYANTIPMAAVNFEAGYQYCSQEQRKLKGKKHGWIIMIWEDEISPKYAQKWHSRSGKIVDSAQNAVILYRKLNLK